MPTNRPLKKTESIEIRVDHAAKRDFMEACRRKGETASAVLRGFIARYVREAATAPASHTHPEQTLMRFVSAHRKSLCAAAAAIGAAVPVLIATNASNAADARLAAFFEWIDTNRDGRLSMQEIASPPPNGLSGVRIELGTKQPLDPKTERTDVWRSLDANRDGAVTLEELADGVEIATRLDAPLLEADANTDGGVTEGELAAYIAAAGLATEAANAASGAALMAKGLMGAHDLDGDGALSGAELAL